MLRFRTPRSKSAPGIAMAEEICRLEDWNPGQRGIHTVMHTMAFVYLLKVLPPVIPCFPKP